MATAVTLLTMRTRARRFAAMENSTFVTDAEVNDYLNAHLAELYDLLRGAYGDEYYQSTQNITTTSNTELYALPADFISMQRVEAKISGNSNSFWLVEYMPAEAAALRSIGAVYSLRAPYKFRCIASNISFLPLPQSADVVTIYYTPTFTPLAADGSTFDSINYWENFAVWGAVADMLAKEESDASYSQGQVEVFRARIAALADQRSEGQPQRIADVSGRWGR